MIRTLLLWVMVSLFFTLASCDKVSYTTDKNKKAADEKSSEPVKNLDSLAKEKVKIGGKFSDKHKNQSDLMYNVLAAEIAGQQRHLDDAVKFYLQAIKISKDKKLAKRATRISLYAKNIDGALEASRRWSVLEPGVSEPYRYVAVLYLRKENIKESVKALNRYHKLLKKPNKVTFPAIARMFALEKDKKTAYEVMRRFFAQFPTDNEALFAFSRFALHVKKYDVALWQVNLALKKRPDWSEASLLRARILISMGKKEQALKSMRAVLKAKKNSRKLRISYARLLTEAKRYKEARRQFKILLKQKPSDTNVIYALALLALENKQYSVSEIYFKKMLKKRARIQESRYHLGLIYEKLKRYDTAIAWLSKVKEGDRAIDAHLKIVTIMSRKGDVEAARRFLYQLKSRTKNLEVRKFLTEADILHRANRTDDAIEIIKNALDTNPGNVDLLYARAMMAEKVSRLDLLESDLKRIIKEHPKHAQALNALGYTLADRTTRFKEAYKYIKLAMELSPDQAAIVDSMGWVQYRLGNYEVAVKHLRRALDLDSNAEIAAHLGEVLWVNGNKSEAIKVWDRGKKIDKSNKVLKSTLKRFRQ